MISLDLDFNPKDDYEKYKTPFYKIRVAPASSSNYIDLPDAIARLIKKVEIVESQESCIYNHQITIVMAEGSRDPYAYTADAADPNVYSLGESGGALTNKSGLIPDLRYSSGGVGITAVSPANAAKALAGLQAAATEDITVYSNSVTGKAPTYLFQEFNKVEITWGYLENPITHRTIRSIIYVWQTEFPDAGQPETTITCLGANALYNQLAFSKNIDLNKIDLSKTLIDPVTGEIAQDFIGLATNEVIELICDKVGIKHYVSDKIEPKNLPEGKFRKLPKGKNVDSFFSELARETQCHYIAFIDHKTDDFSIIFVPKQEYDKQVGISQDYLFAYKTPNSILKSLTVRADFSGFFGAYTGAQKSNGKSTEVVSESGETVTVAFENTGIANPSPASGQNKLAIAQNASTTFANLTQQADMNPNAVNQNYAQQKTINDAYCAKNRIVAIEFTCLGFSRLAPPQTIKFSNIGDRYSGRYHLLTVTHTLDENGYSCKGSATNYRLGAGGQPANNATKGVDQPIEMISVPAFASLGSVLGNPDPDSIETFKTLVLG